MYEGNKQKNHGIETKYRFGFANIYYLDQKYDINFKGVYLYFVQIEFKKQHEVWKRL